MDNTKNVNVKGGCGGLGCLVLVLALVLLFNVGGVTTAIAHWISTR